jgi:hypothetical protein
MKEGLRMKLINNHGRIPMPPPYERSIGEWAAMPPPHPPPYMFLTKFSWRSIQQMQEGTTNIAYKIGRLHRWSSLEEDRHNHNTSKDRTRRTININHQKIKEEGERKENNNAFKFSFDFLLFPFLYFHLLCKFIYV